MSALGLTVALIFPALASGETISAKDDYVTCQKKPCIYQAAIAWSEQNSNGVAVSVAMGTQSAVTDHQVKQVLFNDLQHHGVETIKFFYENYDGVATAIAFHVRGGVEGTFGIDNVRDQVKGIALRAKNTNSLFGIN